jgi:glucose/arabinose dehydrogenase
MLSAPGRLARAAIGLLLPASALLSGCYAVGPSQGGAQVQSSAKPRDVRPKDVAVPAGYRIEKVADGLTFPTAVLFDDRDRLYVVESGYSAGESWAVPKLLRLEPHERWTVVASGDKNGPWTGAVYHKGFFYVTEGGTLEGGRVLRVEPDNGRATTLVSGLPSTGDHPTEPPAVGPDGYLYFGQGTQTNSGVVGDDNRQLGWVSRYPEAHDVPCADVTLSGRNYATELGQTGAFLPLGTPSVPNQIIKGRLPCSGAIMRVPLVGKPDPELVAWGFRDPFGLAFSPQGRLFVVDNGYDERGSRPVWGAADLLWSVSTGTWYGWPDYSGDRPVAAAEFKPILGAPVAALLASAPGRPPRPAAQFGVHSSAHGLDFSRSDAFGHVGEAFVAEYGDLAPFNGKVAGPVGFKVVRVDPETGVIEDFAVNRGKRNGPASLLGGGGLERPVAVRFAPDGLSLYVVDFGVVTASLDGPQPQKGTGVLWRITRDE